MGGLLVVTVVENKYKADNSKTNPVVDASGWHLRMSVYMKE